MKKILFTLLISSVFIMCKTSKNTSYTPNYVPGPKAIVYKTKKDYSNNIPVLLTEDKSEIATYFAPIDLLRNNKYAIPTKLKDDFLLDHIGLNANVAYTSLTHSEYKNYMQNHNSKDLYNLIIDNNPIKEMYNCGNISKMNNPVETLNNIIENKQLKNCRKLK